VNPGQKKLAADKIGLIYEFNNKSPLFARVADKCIKNNEVDLAISILENGIKLFPDYPTGYFILGIALANNGKINEARDLILAGDRLLKNDSAKEFYLKKIDDIAENESKISPTKHSDFLDQESDVSDEIQNNTNEIDLDELAAKISNAKKIKVDNNKVIDESAFNINYDSSIIASETLAEIYIEQGSFTEAIETYSKLIETRPEKKEIYEMKISEIKKRLDS